MSINGKAYIVGAFEHPTRKAPDKSVAQLHAECARGAIADAGLTKSDVDGYFCTGDAPGAGGLNLANYMGLRLRHLDSTDTGGSSYILHLNHAAQAIAMGKCNVALITLAGRPRSEKSIGTSVFSRGPGVPDEPFELPYSPVVVNMYAMVAMRHNHPANRGGMTKIIEAVRQLRGEAHPAVQVKNCGLALAHGTGGSLGHRHGSATAIMERE